MRGDGSERHDAAAAAQARLERARPELPWELAYFSPFYARAPERYQCAELRLELGRCEEALRWYVSLADFMPHTLPLPGAGVLSPGRDPRATRAAGEGDHADPELQPTVDEARARTARLGEAPR